MALMGRVARVSAESVNARFHAPTETRAPSPEEYVTHKSFQLEFDMLGNHINEQVGDSREKMVALDRLEEALMWLNKAVFKASDYPEE